MEKIPKILELTGNDVVLRSYFEQDFKATYEAVKESISELSAWMPWCHPKYSLEDHKKWSTTRKAQWDQGVEYDFVIFRPDSSVVLGICGLNNFDRQNQRANLGYWVRTSQTRKGLATAAAHLLAGFGFDVLGMNRIEILVAEKNYASQKVAEKLGVIKEGLLRKRLIIQDRAHHAFLYSWIKEDYNAHPEIANLPNFRVG